MTFVGKILVIVIMAFALLFLGISTVVFTTATNWKEATDEGAEEGHRSSRQEEPDDATEIVRARDERLTKAQGSSTTRPRRTCRTRVGEPRGRDQAAPGRDHHDQARAARGRAAERQDGARRGRPPGKQETDLLREQKSAVEKQANEYKLRQTELNDKIRELTRELETATNNNKDLRDRVGRFSTRRCGEHGLSDDIATVKGLDSPPTVAGRGRAGRSRRTSGSRSRSARMTAWSPATSCTSTGPSPGRSTSARSRSSPSIPTRPSAR